MLYGVAQDRSSVVSHGIPLNRGVPLVTGDFLQSGGIGDIWEQRNTEKLIFKYKGRSGIRETWRNQISNTRGDLGVKKHGEINFQIQGDIWEQRNIDELIFKYKGRSGPVPRTLYSQLTTNSGNPCFLLKYLKLTFSRLYFRLDMLAGCFLHHFKEFQHKKFIKGVLIKVSRNRRQTPISKMRIPVVQ